MQTYLDTAVYFIYVLAGVTLLGLLALFIMRVRHVWVDKKSRQCFAKFQDYFTYLQAHLDEAERLPTPPGRLTKRERNVIEKKLFALLEQLKGVHRDKLMQLCEDLGLVEQDLRRLRSWWKWTRIDAAYHVGTMRSRQAVPVLRQLLKKSGDDSTRLIIAQALARCAQHLDDLREMVRVLTRSGKNCHAFIVEILRDSEIDCTPLFFEFLREKDHNLLKIALLGLSAHALPNVESTLHSLTHADDKEVRMKAVQLLCRDARNLSDAAVRRFLRHQDWEIRAIAAQAIGELGLQAYIPLLKEAVGDPVWWVRSNSAHSLAKLGIEGFTALCEIVREETYGNKKEMALQVIQEELEKGAYLHTEMERKLQYNQRLHVYQKMCEKKHA
ncbi:HEAT repeat domain-containing protein [Brevibacillus marinus]|uniref:HEAT repeat domain-containing protein n=1 Tax=Brevibacillus marinus TaxID=2496837 RepID=UPI000F82DD60|nr:HEAT repeat domain-containing protein [Brevibacillus marinus]